MAEEVRVFIGPTDPKAKYGIRRWRNSRTEKGWLILDLRGSEIADCLFEEDAKFIMNALNKAYLRG